MYICGKLSDTDILSEVLNNKSISVGDNEDIEDEVEKRVRFKLQVRQSSLSSNKILLC